MKEMVPKSWSFRTVIESFIGSVILVLFLARFFQVAESASQGETLWVVAAWLTVLAVRNLSNWSSESAVRSIDWLDVSVGLLAGGHILSALIVVLTSGEKRAAINLAWEWVGIAVAWFLLRQECQSPRFRNQLMFGLVASGVVAAGLGLFQHYVEFPRMAAKYGPLFDRLKTAAGIERTNIQRELVRENIPVEEPGVTLFEKRLRDSREPIGLFALANTLGGFLAVCLILLVSLIGTTLLQPSANRYAAMVLWILFSLVVIWCLLLTKSRTAWVGAAVGLMIWFVQAGYFSLNRRRIAGIFGVAGVLVAAVWGLGQFGGLDRQVFTEAPKSFQYRLQYWSATSRMVFDHLLWGVGPGQFRGKYLFYKLPEASEEILDPHNLILDVAANGGLIAASGLATFLAIMSLSLFGRSRSNSDSEPAEVNLSNRYFVRWTCGISLIVWISLLFTGFDDRLLFMLPLTLVIAWGLGRLPGRDPSRSSVWRVGALSAAVTLTVHLLGAGGIEMPAITLLLLGLVGGVSESGVPFGTVAFRGNRLIMTGGLLLSLSLFVVLVLTALRPVLVAQTLMSAGDRAIQQGRAEAADTQYQAAAAADPLFAEPWRRRSEIAFQAVQANQFRSNDSFLKAVQLLREASSRDPANSHDDRRLADWWKSKWQITGNTADLEESITALKRAWQKYPTNAAFMAELAIQFDLTGNHSAANDMAAKALGQDQINRQWQHVDRYLSESVRRQLQTISSSSPERAASQQQN